MEIFNETFGLLEEALNIRSEKNRVIAANIANQETPGYHAKELNFREALQAASSVPPGIPLTRSDGSHLPGKTTPAPSMAPVDIPGSSKRLDGNTVDGELEMAKLAENQIQYNAAIQFLSDKFKMIQYSITEGK